MLGELLTEATEQSELFDLDSEETRILNKNL